MALVEQRDVTGPTEADCAALGSAAPSLYRARRPSGTSAPAARSLPKEEPSWIRMYYAWESQPASSRASAYTRRWSTGAPSRLMKSRKSRRSQAGRWVELEQRDRGFAHGDHACGPDGARTRKMTAFAPRKCLGVRQRAGPISALLRKTLVT